MYPENGNTPVQCGDNCGTMPECAPLAVPYVPFQQTGSKRYSQSEALANGTLYPGLNLPFRVKNTGGRMAQTPLTELQALEFVVQELALYLDTHPSDAEAFELFRQYTALEREARSTYASSHSSPLLRSEAADGKTYTWLKDPWPWGDMGTEGK